MRFDAKFKAVSLVRNLQFHGKGKIHLQDAALILEGEFPKFLIPFALRFYHRIISEQTYRTIPYSRIIRYRPPGKILRRNHQVVFEDSGRHRTTVAFKLRGSKENTLFAARLHEYMVAAKALLPV